MTPTDRLELFEAIAKGLCHAIMRVAPDLPCVCTSSGLPCHASTIYRKEAIGAVMEMEKAGFVITRPEVEPDGSDQT